VTPSMPHVLQPALPPVRNRHQGPSRDSALLAPRVPRSAPLGDPPQRDPGQRRSCFPSGQSARSRRMPRESLDTPEDLPKESRCQVALGQLQDEVPSMSA
jgi:hypothetical protein